VRINRKEKGRSKGGEDGGTGFRSRAKEGRKGSETGRSVSKNARICTAEMSSWGIAGHKRYRKVRGETKTRRKKNADPGDVVLERSTELTKKIVY